MTGRRLEAWVEVVSAVVLSVAALAIAWSGYQASRWTGEQAKSEAKRYGIGFWQVKMKDYIGDYYKRRVGEQKKALTEMVEQRALLII